MTIGQMTIAFRDVYVLHIHHQIMKLTETLLFMHRIISILMSHFILQLGEIQLQHLGQEKFSVRGTCVLSSHLIAPCSLDMPLDIAPHSGHSDASDNIEA